MSVNSDVFQQLFQKFPVSMLLVGLDGKIENINNEALKMFKYDSFDDLCKFTDGYTYNFFESLENKEYLLEQLDLKDSGSLNAKFKCKDGSSFYGRLTVVQAELNNDFKSKVCTLENVSKQKTLEQELKVSQERFFNTFQASPDAMSINHIKDGRYTDINESFTRLTGYSFGDINQKSVIDINIWKNPEDRKHMGRELKKFGHVTNIESQFRLKDGSIRDGMISASLINIQGKDCILSVVRDVTEKKKYEEELLRSRSILKESQRIAKIGTWEYDIITGEMKWGDEAYNILGFDKKKDHPDIDRLFSLLHPDDLERANRTFRQIDNTNQFRDFKGRLIRPDGVEIVVVVAWEKGPDDSKSNNRILGIVQDITALEEAQRQMSENHAKLQSVFSAAPVAIAHTINRRFAECNNALITITGYSREELIGKSPRMLYVTTEEHNYVWKMQLEYRKKKVLRDIETRWKRKNGDVIQVLLRFASLNPDKPEQGATVTALDITERKNVENALKKNEGHLKEAEALAHVGHFYFNFLEKKLEWSEEIYRIFEMKPSKLLPSLIRVYLKFVHPDDKELVYKSYTAALRKRIPLKLDYRIIVNEKIKHIRIVAKIRYDKNKIPLNAVGALQDVTQLKQVELELRNHKENLEEIVEDRTQSLNESNEKLIKVNQDLKERNEIIVAQKNKLENTLQKLHDTQNQLIQSEKMASLGILTTGVAHEINNPLNFIQGGISGLEKYIVNSEFEKDKKVQLFVEGIKTGIGRARKIVQGLNQFGRETDSPTEDCDIHLIIDNCLIMVENQMKNKVIVFKQYTDEKYKVLGNVGKLHQVFLNLLTNAEQAIDKKGTINITTEIIDNRFSIRIKDSGCGISAENLKKIMDPFFTTKAPGRGTGLGLSITYRIIEEHKGDIKFTSLLNRGTTAIVKLPLNESNE